MKGFVITLDAVVALSFLLFAMLIISSQSYLPRAPGGIYLKQLTLDTITVLEKTGRLERALSGEGQAIQQVIDATPELSCISVSLIDQSGETVVSSIKSGCEDSAGLDVQASTSPARLRGAMYIVRSESWFRKEP